MAILSYLRDGASYDDRKTQRVFIDTYVTHVLDKAPHIDFRPLWVGLKITPLCNMRCRHCWVGSGGVSRSTGELLRVIDRLKEMQVLHVTFSGGEPFLREDVFELVASVKRNRMCVEIFTNGSLITRETVDRLDEILDRSVDTIQISWDAATSATYSAQRGVDAFGPVVNAVRMLKRRGFNVRLNFTATSLNVSELFSAYELANHLGADVFSCSLVYGLGGGLSLVEAVEPLEFISQVHGCIEHQSVFGTRLRAFIPVACLSMLAGTTGSQPERCVFRNWEILTHWFINSSGDVYPNVTLEQPELGYGNIFDDDISRLLSGFNRIAPALSDRNLEDTKCASCTLVELCRGGDIGRTYRAYGGIAFPDPARGRTPG